MASIILKNGISIGENRCFIVAEIGQNHQGCLDLAKKLILEAKVRTKKITKWNFMFYLFNCFEL